MQSNAPEKRQMLEARDLERPFGGGLTSIEAVIEVVKSDCPNEWARYCELAHRLVQRKQPTEISLEEAARRLLAADSKFFDPKRAVGRPSSPLIELEKMIAETHELQSLFRKRLVLALQSRRYFLNAYDRLELRTIPPELIRPNHFRFDKDEMELGDGIKLSGVRIVPRQRVSADPPGPKPGQESAKGLACRIARAILDDASRRPPPGRGRRAALARMVRAELPSGGQNYQEDTVQKMIRGTVTEWETDNPDN